MTDYKTERAYVPWAAHKNVADHMQPAGWVTDTHALSLLFCNYFCYTIITQLRVYICKKYDI